MLSDLYWIDTATPHRLAIMARPRAGDWLEDEIAHWHRSGIGVVVSLLEREEVDDLDLKMEASLCEKRGIDFLSFPIPDRGIPSDANAAMTFAADVVSRGKPVAIHCRAGIGRSSIMAAVFLINDGIAPVDALSAIQLARGTSIPDTEAQRDWVLRLEQR